MPIHLTHYTALDGKANDLKAVLENFLLLLRDSDGCISCELLLDVDDVNHLTIKDEWESLEAHKEGLHNIPSDLHRSAMLLLVERPSGIYFEGES